VHASNSQTKPSEFPAQQSFSGWDHELLDICLVSLGQEQQRWLWLQKHDHPRCILPAQDEHMLVPAFSL
jgi:hypothetical protein